MDNYDLTQTSAEEQNTSILENFDVISARDALIALLPKAMEVAF